VSVCSFNDTYGSGFAVGIQALDVFGLPETTISGVNIGFGVTSLEAYGGFGGDGIWGLASTAFLDWQNNGTVFQSIVAQEGIYNGFSLCLTPTGNPVFSLGVDYSETAGFEFTPLQTIYGEAYWYNVIVDSMSFDGESIPVESDDYDYPIVDSGTSLLYVPDIVWDSIYNTLINDYDNLGFSMSTFLTGEPIDMTEHQISQLPSLEIKLQGISTTLTVPSTAWVVPDGSEYIFGIVESGWDYYGEEAGSVGTILGDVFMENYHVFFDRQHSQIGIASQSTCPTAGGTGSQTTTGGKTTAASVSTTEHHSSGTKVLVSYILLLFIAFCFF